jgi:hypothetical protein
VLWSFPYFRFSAFLFPVFRVPELSRDVPADAGFLCSKFAVVGMAVKEGPCVFVFVVRGSLDVTVIV